MGDLVSSTAVRARRVMKRPLLVMLVTLFTVVIVDGLDKEIVGKQRVMGGPKS